MPMRLTCAWFKVEGLALKCHGRRHPAKEVRRVIAQAGGLEHIVCCIAQWK